MSPTAGHTHSYGGSFRVTPRTYERPVLTGQSRGRLTGAEVNLCSIIVQDSWTLEREILEILLVQRERERKRERKAESSLVWWRSQIDRAFAGDWALI